jgi:hypothetical protein
VLARDARDLEDLTVCGMDKVKESRKGFQDLHLTEMASWCEGGKTRMCSRESQ